MPYISTDWDSAPSAAEAEADMRDSERAADERKALLDYLVLGQALMDHDLATGEYDDGSCW